MNRGKFPGGAGSASGRIGAVVTGLGALGFLGSQCLFNVDGGHRAVKYSRLLGVLDKVYGEGTHIYIPFIERPILYDARTKPIPFKSSTGTKDLQMVDIMIRVLAKPDTDHLPTIYKELGLDYSERILPSIANEVLKSVVAQFNASQLITQREMVSRLIRQRLMERASSFHIILDDVAIVNVVFGSEFSNAVEAKQVAQQEAQRAAFIVDRAMQEKQSIIVKAEGEAKSAQMIGEAISKNPSFLDLRRIEAAREVAHTISKSSNRVFLNSDALLLNVNKVGGGGGGGANANA